MLCFCRILFFCKSCFDNETIDESECGHVTVRVVDRLIGPPREQVGEGVDHKRACGGRLGRGHPCSLVGEGVGLLEILGPSRCWGIEMSRDDLLEPPSGCDPVDEIRGCLRYLGQRHLGLVILNGYLTSPGTGLYCSNKQDGCAILPSIRHGK